MVYRIAGGIAFVLMGLTLCGLAIPAFITGVFAVVAGVALLAGL